MIISEEAREKFAEDERLLGKGTRYVDLISESKTVTHRIQWGNLLQWWCDGEQLVRVDFRTGNIRHYEVY